MTTISTAAGTKSPRTPTRGGASAVLAGGCFWCLQPAFKAVRGVTDCVVGYAGGHSDQLPTYQNLKTTGYAECVKVEFDPAVVSYSDILDIFFLLHDPTQLNRQGEEDVGTQYRTAIFVETEAERRLAKEAIKRAQASWTQPIVTTLESAPFYVAEDYHQDYYISHPENVYCKLTVSKKLAKARKSLAKYLLPTSIAEPLTPATPATALASCE